MKTLLFIFMLLSFWGCSGGQGTNTTLSVSRSFIVGAQAGGLMVYITNKTKNTTSAISLQSTTKTITLEHGEYNFKAVGWDGAEPMQGNLLCGETTTNLKDPKATVEINILKSNCENENFVPAAFRATGGVAALKLTSCNDIASANAYDSLCDNSQRGTIGSYRVRLVSYDANASINPSIGLNSLCIVAQAAPSGSTTTGIKLPYGNSAGNYSTAIETFLDGNCSSGKATHYYPFGLGNSSTGSSSVVLTNGYTANLFTQSSNQILGLSSISMSSSNSNVGYAKIGDTVVITFVPNRAASFNVTINGITATVTNSASTYIATHVLTGAEPDGAVYFEISAEGMVFNSTTDYTYLNFLKSAPATTLSLLNPAVSPSNNPQPTFQVDNITNNATAYLYVDSTCTTQVASSPYVGTVANLQISSPLTQGSWNFSSKQIDPAGNVSTCSAPVSYTYAHLTLSNINSTSNNFYNPSNAAKNGDIITINFDSNFTATYTAMINGNPATVNTTGPTSFQITYPVSGIDADGPALLTINSSGTTIISNQPMTVIIDNTPPIMPAMTRTSPGQDAHHSKDLVLEVSGLEDGGQLKIYSNAACSVMATLQPIIGPTQNITLTNLAMGQHSFFARQYDQAGNESPCTSTALQYRVKHPFISVWQTTVANETITLPLPSGFTYDYIIDWGDGSGPTTGSNYNVSHSYTTPGQYTITITGKLEAWKFNASGDALKIKQVTDFGEMDWKNLNSAFKGCTSLTTFNGGDFSQVIDMGSMFAQATNVTPITTDWNTVAVTNMASLFYHAEKADPDTTNWNTASVTQMESMFEGALLADPNTATWDTSSVNNMARMFKEAPVANPNTSNWLTNNVRYMSEMFRNATAANPDVSAWDTSKVTQMHYMFAYAVNANPNVTNWNTELVTSMTSMFDGALLANPDTSNWDIGIVTNLDYIFTDSSINKDNWSKFLVMAGTTATISSANAIVDVNTFHNSTAASPITTLQSNFGWSITDLGLQ